MDHWSAPDVPRDILAAAWLPGLPDPTEIHIRPELARMLGDVALPSPAADAATVRIVVDDAIPQSPGYEIHRAL